jgi:hypothetical protein
MGFAEWRGAQFTCVYLLYWYKRADSDAAAGTKVQIVQLRHYWYKSADSDAAAALFANRKCVTTSCLAPSSACRH